MRLFSYFSLVLVAIFMSVQSVDAKKLPSIYSEMAMASASVSTRSSSTSNLSSSLELDYLFIEDQTAIGGSLLLGGLVITGEYAPYDELVSGVKSMAAWSAGAGINKRIHVANFLIFEGRAGADYTNCSVKYDDGTKSDYDGSWGAFANARIGVKLFGNTCVTVGYKWKFSEFRFSEEYRSSYMTAGVAFLF